MKASSLPLLLLLALSAAVAGCTSSEMEHQESGSVAGSNPARPDFSHRQVRGRESREVADGILHADKIAELPGASGSFAAHGRVFWSLHSAGPKVWLPRFTYADRADYNQDTETLSFFGSPVAEWDRMIATATSPATQFQVVNGRSWRSLGPTRSEFFEPTPATHRRTRLSLPADGYSQQ